MPQKLGQHFLKSKRKLRKIAESLNLQDNDTVIEIGPGHGELTREIRKQKIENRIICIEKDLKLAVEIESLELNNLKVITGDALKILPEITKHYSLNTRPYKLTGNIPYYITGHLFRIISELKNKPSISVFTIQKEVAERICALQQVQGKPKMNLLAASVQFWAEPKIVGYVPKKYFHPAPKVDSAIIKLETRKQKIENRMSKKYYKFIRIIFKQPRKTILNNLIVGFNTLKKGEIIEKLSKVGVRPDARSQNLKIEELSKLSTLF